MFVFINRLVIIASPNRDIILYVTNIKHQAEEKIHIWLKKVSTFLKRFCSAIDSKVDGKYSLKKI